MWEIHWWSPHKRPVTRNMFPLDDVIMRTGFYIMALARVCRDCPQLDISGAGSSSVHQSSLLALCDGNPSVTDGFPHKWPVMWKAFPCHDVIMNWPESADKCLSTSACLQRDIWGVSSPPDIRNDVRTCDEYMTPFHQRNEPQLRLLSGVPDYFGRNKISSGGDLSHYSSASLY